MNANCFEGQHRPVSEFPVPQTNYLGGNLIKPLC